MHPHTIFGIPTSKDIEDMHRTRSGMDGRTLQTDSAITLCFLKFLWGHKNIGRLTLFPKDPLLQIFLEFSIAVVWLCRLAFVKLHPIYRYHVFSDDFKNQ